MVHRDLAARNVLVQTPSCVKITDFGLAKLLDYDSDEYRAAGGKMPIKWLALECIRHRVFTSKSDVWAFGVTIWELLTYGCRPYENVAAKDVPELIEIGHKLPQPDICSLDVYCILLSCWVLDADARPSFKTLSETFAEKARDPGRYLMIPGDKFMRLPSYTNQDEKEQIRTLAPTEMPGTIVEADEYLQPKTRPALMVPTGPYHHHHHQEHHQQNGDLPKSLRYCKDPLKPDDETDSNAREVGVGGLRLNLPLDEDDYLMPTCQSQAPSVPGYMDLIGVPASVDNPEYLMGSAANVSTGLPTPPPIMLQGPNGSCHFIPPHTPTSVNSLPCSTVSTVSATVPTTTINNNNPAANNANKTNEAIQMQAAPPTQTLGIPLSPTETESTSEHEYVNDLQRELIPLHRNETTV